METTKRIGILGTYYRDKDIVGVSVSYMKILEQFPDCDIYIINPFNTKHLDLDLLILPGGADLDPILYNNKPDLYSGTTRPEHTFFVKNVLPKYLLTTKVVGICLGAQMLNVVLGGSLIQHVPDHVIPSDKTHNLIIPKYDILTGEDFSQDIIDIINNVQNFKTDVATSKEISINSRHHQSFGTVKRTDQKTGKLIFEVSHHLANKLLILGVSDNVVEVFKHKNKHIWGFQYHPEDINCSFFKAVIHHLLFANEVQK